jgi:RHS repeat-associated protein
MNRTKVLTATAGLASTGVLALAMLGGEPGAPQVDVAGVNPGAAVERDLCLSVSVGPGAASECGDLRLAHALPAVRTLNQARAPVLLYNSQHASPHPVVAAHVTLPSGTAGLSRVVAVLKVNGTPRGQGVWKGSTWPGGGPVRIAVGYDAAGDPTGPYRYTLEVRAHYGTTAVATTARGELVVVNRRESPFGAGWWLAGLEQLVMDPSNRPLLWVGGDGSTRRYTVSPGDTSVWGAASLDRPDTLKRAGTGWERILPGGVKVRFDAAGNHVATRSRIGHETSFGYASGRLASVSVPPTGSGLSYSFVYGVDGLLERAGAPGVQGARNVILTRTGIELSIQDPDGTPVAFTHADAARRRIVARKNRLGHTAFFRYDRGGRIASARQDLGGDSIVTRLRALESVGLATDSGGGAVDTARAYALLDGPRTDVGDSTRLWLDRWGAPRRIVNALRDTTVLTRGNPAYPALVTRLRLPNGLTTEAAYTSRGLVDSTVVIAPYGDNRNAVTSYAYTDPNWPDFVTRIKLPQGEITSIEYEPATGHRAWTQPGEDQTRRVTFGYNESGLLDTIAAPPVNGQSAFEVFRYDARGNLEYAVTPRGYTTRYHNDALGRTWKTEMPIDGTRVATTSSIFDAADRVKESRTTAPLRPGIDNTPQTLVVETDYDSAGNVLRVTRRDSINAGGIGAITTRWRYDAAGRRVAEVAPDLKVDSTEYDLAGNAVRVITRRGDTLRTRYDALGRPLFRYHSATRYEAIRKGIYTLTNHPSTGCAGDPDYYYAAHSYPQFPTNGTDCSYTLPADSSVFEYDRAGNLVRAGNRDALVRRGYHPNGSVAWDSLYVRTMDGNPDVAASFAAHKYGLEFEYDLNGRRTSLLHPSQLAQGTSAKTRYTYAPVTGEPDTVVDPLSNRFRYRYNVRGQLESLVLPGAVVQGYAYDTDGQLERSTVNIPAVLAAGPVNNTEYSYDQRGKLLRSRNVAGENEEMTAAYSGLGHLISHNRTATGQSQNWTPIVQTSSASYTYDALGNNLRTINQQSSWSSNNFYAQPTTSSGTRGGVKSYEAGTGRHLGTAEAADATPYEYDAAGNLIFESSTGSSESFPRRDRATFFSADGRLRTAEVRELTKGVGEEVRGTWEEYRYDALGRRVWVRTRKFCNIPDQPQACAFSTARRTVWDGDEVLYEIRAADSERENDGTPTRLQRSATAQWDPNPELGRVLLTHGTGLDQPLSAIRMEYSEWAGGAWGAPFSVIPLWDSRGRAPYAVFGNGTRKLARPGQATAQLTTFWLLAWNAYGPRNNAGVLSTGGEHIVWMGSVMEDQQDASGLLYRRNRYYNPASGRFTQEDPIGLAGGVNLYGFANGDPVSYSDPYGLKAEGDCPPCNDMNPRHLELEVQRAEWAGKNPRQALALGATVTLAGVAALAAPELGVAVLTRLGLLGTRAAPVAATAGAAGAAGSRLPNSPQFHAIVSRGGEVLRTTSDITLSHLDFVRRTVGTLPDGATVVTAFRNQNAIQAITSRSVHGVQMPAPRHVVDALNAAAKGAP